MLPFRRVAPASFARVATPATLDHRTIEVWAFSLAGSDADLERWRSLLSCDERDRAERFQRASDANTFIVAHGSLRCLLARYCVLAPAELRFTRSPAGKPTLESRASAGRAIEFNLAHSGNAALVAVSGGVEIGIDLERVRDDVDIEGVATRYFTADESETIMTAPPDARTAAFFRFWVAKEAVLKARGSGLSAALDAFSLCFAPNCESARIDVRDGAFPMHDHCVRMLPVPDGWHAALCAPAGCDVRLRTA
jgi:4'-phosphopantetheinyl transferase